MATYQIHINERLALGRSLVSLLKSVPETVSFETPMQKQITTSKRGKLYKNLDSAFQDVCEIREGRQAKKTIDEFINELRNNQLKQKNGLL